MGGSGVNRSLQFAKFLPSYGYTPIVLTITEEDIAGEKNIFDYSLLKELPAEIQIVRCPTLEPRTFKKQMMRFRIYRFFWFFFFPLFWETSALWSRSAFRSAKKIIKENDIDIIYTSSGPFSSILLGWRIKRQLNVKWVADLRDPYSDGYMWQWPSKLHWFFCRLLEKYFLNKPDVLVVTTPEMKKRFHNRGVALKNEIVVINNGY